MDEAARRGHSSTGSAIVSTEAKGKAMNIPKTNKLPTGTDAVGSNEEQLRRLERAEAEIRASQDSAITDAFIARMKRRLELYALERGKPKPDPQ